MRLRSEAWILSVGVMAAAAGTAPAQGYPNRPIRVVTSEAGGGNDRMARVLAQAMSVSMGQQVTVDNRPAGVTPGEIVSKAPPDGHTLLVYNNSVWIAPLIEGGAQYDAVRDFAPISELARTPNVLIVKASSPARSVPELIAMAKANPGLKFGSSGAGATARLAGELFAAMAGVKLVHVGFKGNAASVNALLADEVQVLFPTASSAMPLVSSGKARALGVTSTEPSPLAPGVPPVAESGLPGYASTTIFGAFAPAATPRAVVARLNDEMVRFLGAPGMKEKLAGLGMDAVGSSPQEFAATVKSELARMTKVIRDAGIRVE